MKILSPLDSAAEVDVLVDAGAGEFYCGLLDERWHESYPVISLNRRPAGKGHFRSFADLAEAVKRAHDRGVQVYFTLNEHYYTDEQYTLLWHYIDGAIEAGVDAFIVTDFGLIASLQDKGIQVPLHCSTGTTVFNRRSLGFFRELGVVNITLPRHLAVEEVRRLSEQAAGLDLTVFILNSRCVNIDGFCTFQHGLAGREIFPMYRNACMLPFNVKAFKTDDSGEMQALADDSCQVQRQKLWERVHVDDHPCGVCALFDLHAMGIGSVKIVGRGNPQDRKLKDVKFVKELVDMVRAEDVDRKRYLEQARRLYGSIYGRECRRFMCYFPELT
jgi:collagenase-like PrtC family protease